MTGNEDNNDRELNRYLQGDSDISRRYAGNKELLPSDELDSKILSAAASQRATGKRVEKHKFHPARWALPLSLAAVVTLSVTLVLNMPSYSRYPVVNDEDYYGPEPATTEAEIVLPREMIKMKEGMPAVMPEQDVAPEAVRKKSASESFTVPQLQELSVEMAADEVQSISVEPKPERLGAAPREEMPANVLQREGSAYGSPAIKSESMKKKMEVEQRSKLRIRATIDELELMDAPASVSAEKSGQRIQENAPEALLVNIQSLLVQGKAVLAQKEWQEFKAKYPEYPEDKIRQILGENYSKLNNPESK